MRTKLLLLLSGIFTLLGNLTAQNALDFDGTNDVVQTTYSGVLGSADRTFEAWIFVSTTAPSSNLTMLDYGTNSAGSRNTFIVDGSRSLRFLSGGTNGNLPASSTTIQAGVWTHVAFVLNNGTGFIYINGVQVSTGNLSGVNTPTGNANVTIGERVSGGSIPFEGKIDEVRIWNVARTPAEIMVNMNTELCSLPASLEAYYKFNHGVAAGTNTGLTNVIDEIGNTATATNFSMTGTTSNWVTGAAIASINPLNLAVTVDTATQVLFSADTSSSATYQWLDCTTNSILVGDTNQSYTTRTGGTFAVIVSNGVCSDTSACLTVNFSGGGMLPGEALSFDGVDDFVQTEFQGVLDSADRTFEAWINVSANAPTANLAIVDYGLNAVGSRNTFNVNSGRGLTFISGGTNANMGTAAGIIPAGQWTHVAFVLDNGIGFLYLNGVQVGTANLSAVNTPSGNDSLIIGQRVSGGSIPFAGEIDEVRIWSVARSQAEIMADMNTIYCGPTPNLAAYYNMNQGIAGGNNSAIVKVFNPLNTGEGFLNNFAMTGATSNFVGPGAKLSAPVVDTTVSTAMRSVGLVLVANDSTVDSYQWIDCSNNQPLPLDTFQAFLPPGNGNYAVILTKNGCSDTSACVNVIGVGLEDEGLESNFYIAQNPFKEHFELINKTGMNINIMIRSIHGREVLSLLNANQRRHKIELSGAASGVYLVTVETEDESVKNFKVIKE